MANFLDWEHAGRYVVPPIKPRESNNLYDYAKTNCTAHSSAVLNLSYLSLPKPCCPRECAVGWGTGCHEHLVPDSWFGLPAPTNQALHSSGVSELSYDLSGFTCWNHCMKVRLASRSQIPKYAHKSLASTTSCRSGMRDAFQRRLINVVLYPTENINQQEARISFLAMPMRDAWRNLDLSMFIVPFYSLCDVSNKSWTGLLGTLTQEPRSQPSPYSRLEWIAQLGTCGEMWKSASLKNSAPCNPRRLWRSANLITELSRPFQDH